MVRRHAGLLALVLVGCSSNPPPAATTAPPPSAAPSAEPAPAPSAQASAAPATSSAAPAASAKPAPQDDPAATPREKLMRAHFNEAATVRTALIKGSVREAVAPAEALAKMDGVGTVKPAAKPSIDALQAASKRISQSSDVPGVAAAIADIGLACGSCHKATGGPAAKSEPAPADDKSVAGRMARHAWATERLWESLYVPADASWKAGVDALSGDPFPKEILDKGGVHARSAASRFKQIVATAGDKKKAEDRAKTYATLLETCSSCHMAVKNAK